MTHTQRSGLYAEIDCLRARAEAAEEQHGIDAGRIEVAEAELRKARELAATLESDSLSGWKFDSEDHPWRWKNTRSIGISVGLWPIEWALGIDRADDQFGGQVTALIGPLEFTLSYNDGSALRAKSGAEGARHG